MIMISSAHDIIPRVVYKQLEFQNVLKKTAEVATHNQLFSTEAFENAQAKWWLFEIKRGGKA